MDPIDIVCGCMSDDGTHVQTHFASSRNVELWEGEAEILRMLAGSEKGEVS
jgi:hypothetical protein